MNSKVVIHSLLKNGDWNILPGLLKTNVRKSSLIPLEVKDNLIELNKQQQRNLWSSAINFLVKNIPGNAGDENSNGNENKENNNLDQEVDVVKSMLDLALIQIDFTQVEKEAYKPVDSLVQFIVLIGSVVGEFESELQELGIKVCEAWILKELECYQEIISNILLLLIRLSMQKVAKKASIKRIWALRKGLSYLDMKHIDLAVEKLLVACVAAPIFLSCDEGIKFLSLLFSIESLVMRLHKTVKDTLPIATRTQSGKYAQVYFRAWKNSRESLQQLLEEDCLQDLMFGAVHIDCINSSTLSTNLNAFLHYIHKNNKHPPTASMIHKLYEPIIWRSLKVSNGYVRMNAAALFCSAYPFSDYTMSQEEQDELMQKQNSMLITMLTDPCHLVRITMIKGVFLLLHNFWLVVPPHIIQSIFQICLTKLVEDASSADVRVEVIKGITGLLDCPDACPFLTEVLPKLTESFDDVNSNVRVAFVKLLYKVKATRLIKYWKLVPMEHLLIRMVSDSPAIRTLIIQIIQNSFLPANANNEALVGRCIALLEMNRDASRLFYQHSSKRLDLNGVTRFMLTIWQTIHVYVRKSNAQARLNETDNSMVISPRNVNKRASKSQSSQREDKENNEPEASGVSLGKENDDDLSSESEFPLDDPNIVCGLMDTFVILWAVNSPRLGQSHNTKYLSAIRTVVSKTFANVWSFFKEDSQISNTLLYLSSFLPRTMVPTMKGFCLSKLKSLTDDVEEKDFVPFINAICNWNCVDDIFELITEWIEAAFHDLSPSQNKKGKSNVPCVRFHSSDSSNPMLALRILEHLLIHPINRLCLLQKNRECFVSFIDVMDPIQLALTKRLEKGSQISNVCSDEFLIKCLHLYLTSVTVLHHIAIEQEDHVIGHSGLRNRNSTVPNSDIPDFNSIVYHNRCMDWAENHFSIVEESDFSHRLHVSLLRSLLNSLATGRSNNEFVVRYSNFLNKFIERYFSDVELMVEVMKCLSVIYEFMFVYLPEECNELPFSMFKKVLCGIDKKFIDQCNQEVSTKFIDEVANTAISLGSNSGESFLLVVNFLYTLVFENIKQVHEGVGRFEKEYEEMSSARMLLGVVTSKAKLSCKFIKIMEDSIIDKFNIETSEFMIKALIILSQKRGKIAIQTLKRLTTDIEKCVVIYLNEYTRAENETTKEGESMDQNSDHSGDNPQMKLLTKLKDVLQMD